MKRVAIIGGGFAGLAAGVDLAERGFAVTVLEGRPRLGGRAYSFRDERSGATIDNGQHAMMGCYTHTLEFLERIGGSQGLVRQPNLRVALLHPTRGRGAIDCPALPGPLHALAGVLRYRLLDRRERLRALVGGLGMLAMRRRRDARLASLTIEELLVALGQSENARQSFWNPIAVATCNESPARASAAPFAEVMALAFFGSRTDSQFVFSRVGLSELYTGLAQRAIERRGGRVTSRAHVKNLSLSDGRVTALMLHDGSRIEVDACVSALPPEALGPVLDESGLGADPWFRGIAGLESSPIVSAHLWFDRPLLDEDFVGLLGRTTQWVFDRGRLAEGAAGRCLSAVISAGREVAAWEPSAIAETIVADLRALLPAARSARLEHSVVIKEKRATISTTPAAERLRPRCATPVPNLYLAGDWTATGLPPTIESAVASGNRAATLAAAQLAAR
ncbi:MAG TPA: hydroxysqualene dehydroxylase HpnE [Candidatus Bathyarchaeia archaeon]|nr:hydroxysqualene dehydroxylase HpnE [Candidatus Bathyarchaeia archaeon]